MAPMTDPSFGSWWLNQDTFVGATLAAAAGSAVVAAVGGLAFQARSAWRRATHLRLAPTRKLSLDERYDRAYGEAVPDLPVALADERGIVHLTLSCVQRWSPTLIEIKLREKRRGLPRWFPRATRPAPVERATVGLVSVQRPGGFDSSSFAKVDVESGRWRGTVLLDDHVALDRDDEVPLEVELRTAGAWRGLVVVRVQIDRTWYRATCDVDRSAAESLHP